MTAGPRVIRTRKASMRDADGQPERDRLDDALAGRDEEREDREHDDGRGDDDLGGVDEAVLDRGGACCRGRTPRASGR